MPCDRKHLSAYLDGALDRDEAATVEAHLRHCPKCAAIFQDYRTLGRGLATLPTITPPADLAAGIRGRLRRLEKEAGAAERWPVQPVIGALAVAVVFGLLALLALRLPAGGQRLLAPAQVAYADIDTRSPEPKVEIWFTGPVDRAAIERAVQIDPPAEAQFRWYDNRLIIVLSRTANAEAYRVAIAPAQTASGTPFEAVVPVAATERETAPAVATVAAPEVAHNPAPVPAPPVPTATVLPSATPMATPDMRFVLPTLPALITAEATPSPVVTLVAMARPAATPEATVSVPTSEAAGPTATPTREIATALAAMATRTVVETPAPLLGTATGVASACAPGPSFAAAYRSRPDLATRTGCPLGPERSVVVLTQAFERGQLLRLDEARQAYVLLTGGRFWTVTLDFSREPFALSGFGTPPAGLLAPDKLFGRLWRDPKISQTLGWALSAERSFTGILQETMRAILLLDDQRRVQVLFHEGSFLTVTP